MEDKRDLTCFLARFGLAGDYEPKVIVNLVGHQMNALPHFVKSAFLLYIRAEKNEVSQSEALLSSEKGDRL